MEDIDSKPPRKTLSIKLQDRAWAVTNPIRNTPMNFTAAVTMALPPTFSNFLKLNSKPRPNIRNIMPISDHWWTVASLDIPGKKLMFGPIKKPARM